MYRSLYRTALDRDFSSIDAALVMKSFKKLLLVAALSSAAVSALTQNSFARTPDIENDGSDRSAQRTPDIENQDDT